MSAIRLHMFSGPRNISTTLMRSFGCRADMAAVDEPFYASYLAESGVNHPYRIETLAAQPNERIAVLDWIGGPLEAFDTPDADYLFCKHIAYHLPPNFTLDWLLDGRTFLLIRDPRRMVASYSQKFEDIEPIVDSFAAERRIYDFLAVEGRVPPIVDSADILRNPAAMLQALCDALSIPYTDEMLAWPEGPASFDGAWGPHWYDAVYASTGFKPYRAPPLLLTPEQAKAAQACASDYAFLYERRLTV